MSSVSWDDLAKYIEASFNAAGMVDRSIALEMAFNQQAPDSVVDAIDGLGSRIFPNPDAAKAFLKEKGYIAG